jgi:hypothetical protein
MRALLLVPYYVRWHYGRALKGVFDITLSGMWFFWHFFSISILAKTFFAPFERLHETRHRKFDVEEMFSTVAVNTVMRLVGMLVRAVFIVVGLLAIVLICITGIVGFFAWLMLPALCAFLIIMGFTLLLN